MFYKCNTRYGKIVIWAETKLLLYIDWDRWIWLNYPGQGVMHMSILYTYAMPKMGKNPAVTSL